MLVIPNPVALRLGQAGSGLTLTGAAAGVPWAADVECLVALVPGPAGHWVVSLPPSAVTIQRRRNLAGEPRDAITAEGVALAADRAAPAPASRPPAPYPGPGTR